MEKYIVYPQIDKDSAPYWKYLQEHKAHLQKCTDCGRFRFPPYPSCTYCGAMGGSWEPVSGEGTIYTWIVIHHPIDPRLAAEVPFAVVMVEMKEGVRMAGRMVGCSTDQIEAGMPVKALYDDIDDKLTLINFRPVGEVKTPASEA